MRYLQICLLILSLLVPLGVVEWLFQTTGSGLSIFDTKGAGQVMLFVVIFAMVAGFTAFVARDNPLKFFLPYFHEWRRALGGFAAMLLFASLVVIAGYLGFAALGSVGWSEAGIAAMRWKIVERTIVGLLVVVILAISEEILFRVFLMRYLRWNNTALVTIGAVVFSSLVFAASHKLTAPQEWFSSEGVALFIGLFILGVLLCVTYLSTGSFLCNVGIHAGLLGSKVFLRKTQLVEVDPSALFLGDSYDLRMSPIVWAVFAGMALAIFLNRHRLFRRFAVEDAVVSHPVRQAASPAGSVG